MTYPTRHQATDVFLEKFFHNHDMFQHGFVVAKTAAIIASECGMDAEKAFVLGLLHDYGYNDKKPWHTEFHGKVGYYEMNKKGWGCVAKICLTHSFPYKNVMLNNYKKEWQDWSRVALLNIEYDDYDMLIQLCDMLVVSGRDVCSFEERIADIATRHKISTETQRETLENCKKLKQHFDTKCGCDVYDLLEIER